MASPRRLRLPTASLLAVHLLCAVGARAGLVSPALWGTDGTVSAVIRSGNTIYLGGGFSLVGPNSGGAVPVRRTTGAPLTQYPKVVGVVLAVVPDGAGGWFIAGTFDRVGDAARHNLAHILGDG